LRGTKQSIRWGVIIMDCFVVPPRNDVVSILFYFLGGHERATSDADPASTLWSCDLVWGIGRKAQYADWCHDFLTNGREDTLEYVNQRMEIWCHFPSMESDQQARCRLDAQARRERYHAGRSAERWVSRSSWWESGYVPLSIYIGVMLSVAIAESKHLKVYSNEILRLRSITFHFAQDDAKYYKLICPFT